MVRNLIIITIATFVVACAPQQPAPKKQAPKEEIKKEEIKKEEIKRDIIYLDSLVLPKKLAQKEILENRQIRDEYLKKKAIIARITKADFQEQKMIQAKKDRISEEKKKFTAKLLEMIQDDQVKELLKEGTVEEIMNRDVSLEELEQMLKNETDLTPEEIQKLLDYKKLAVEIVSAKDTATMEKILREKTSLSEDKIKELVQRKEILVKQEQDLKFDALAKIYKRLNRNRDLGIEKAFCVKTSPLDQFVIEPISYDFDVYSVKKEASDKLFEEVDFIYDEAQKYTEMALQIEGNADERGSNAYNKALGDRRWSGVVPYLTNQHYDKEDLFGISKGEECQTEKSTDDMENWWQQNRRSDLVWILK